MTRPETKFETDRLILRSWRIDDLDDFARLHADPDTMRDSRRDAGPCWQRTENCSEDYIRAIPADTATSAGASEQRRDDFWAMSASIPMATTTRWDATAISAGGCCRKPGAKATRPRPPVLPWIMPFEHCGLREILAYTQAENLSSQAVIARLPFHRDPSRDFSIEEELARLVAGHDVGRPRPELTGIWGTICPARNFSCPCVKLILARLNRPALDAPYFRD